MLALRPYQEVGRDFLASRRFALLADEMRVGKTPQAILAAAKLGVQSALVVCPAIAVPQWQAEWKRWAGALPAKFEVLSYDKAKTEAERLKLGFWDVVIVDEAHFAKNPEAKRTKLVYGKDGLGWHASRLWSLSGTPMPNHPGELWPMLRAFGAVGMDYRAFTDRYCTFNKWTGKIIGTNTYRIHELRGILSKVMLRRTLKEVAPEVPDVEFDFLNTVPLAADLNIPDHVTDEQLPVWVEAHAVGDREDRIAVAMAKAPILAEHVAFAVENGLQKSVVCFGWHVEPLTNLAQRLEARGISVGLLTGKATPGQKTWVQDKFRDGGIQVVCANILAAGTAIDLSTASYGAFLELDWVGANNVQASKRLVSIADPRPRSFDVCTWPGSADERVQKVVMRKMVGVKAMGL